MWGYPIKKYEGDVFAGWISPFDRLRFILFTFWVARKKLPLSTTRLFSAIRIHCLTFECNSVDGSKQLNEIGRTLQKNNPLWKWRDKKKTTQNKKEGLCFHIRFEKGQTTRRNKKTEDKEDG